MITKFFTAIFLLLQSSKEGNIMLLPLKDGKLIENTHASAYSPLTAIIMPVNYFNVHSCLAGEVIKVITIDSTGMAIGVKSDSIVLIYMYLEKATVKQGDKISKGDYIGTVQKSMDYLLMLASINGKDVNARKYIVTAPRYR